MGGDSHAYSSIPTTSATPITDAESLVPNITVESKRLSVQVTAPSDLQEGFTLNVKVDGKNAIVTVPRGGVRAGEQFVGPVEFLDGSSNEYDHSRHGGGDGIPVGAWRTGPFDCCMQGFFHPLWIMTLCYGALPLAQVQTRMNLDLLGSERSGSHGPSTFRLAFIVFVVWMGSLRTLQALFRKLAPDVEEMTTEATVEQTTDTHVDATILSLDSMEAVFDVFVVLFLIAASFWYRCFLDQPASFRFLLGFLFLVTISMDSIAFVEGFIAGFQDGLEEDRGTAHGHTEIFPVPGAARFVAFLHKILIWGMRLFIIVAGTKTRIFLRQKYAIPGDQVGDCCCIFWCTCCAIVQMSNHTADYNAQRFDFGAENGLTGDNNNDNIHRRRYHDGDIDLSSLP